MLTYQTFLVCSLSLLTKKLVSALAIFDLIAETDELISSVESLFQDCSEGFVTNTLNGFTDDCPDFSNQKALIESGDSDLSDILSDILVSYFIWGDDVNSDDYSDSEKVTIATASSDNSYSFEHMESQTNFGCYWQQVTSESQEEDMIIITNVVQRVDPDCISTVLDEVVDLLTIWEYQINSTCAHETNTIVQSSDVLDTYSESTIYANEIYINHGTSAFFYDYDESTQTDYNSACTAANGVFRQLDVVATCTETSDTTGEVLNIDKIYLNNLPRCYGETCTTDLTGANPYDALWPICYPDYDNDDCSALDDTGLLKALTLDLTEERNAVDGSTWECTGSQYTDGDDMRDEWCEHESSALEESTTLIEAHESIMNSTTIKDKDLWTWWNQKKTVQFSDTTDYTEACEANGATYTATNLEVTCMEVITEYSLVSNMARLEVVEFPSCHSVKCSVNETDVFEVFQEFFVEAWYMNMGDMRNGDGYEIACSLGW